MRNVSKYLYEYIRDAFWDGPGATTYAADAHMKSWNVSPRVQALHPLTFTAFTRRSLVWFGNNKMIAKS